MSNQSGRERSSSARIAAVQWPALVWLTLVWIGLWGAITPVIVVGGVVVAVVVCLVFPLPRLGMDLHVRPLRLAWLVLRFLADVVMASVQVAIVTLRFGREPHNAIIEVDLRTASDFVLTVVAEMVSLVPGSLVVEARRSTHTLFLHVLDSRDEVGVERMRSQVLALERRVVLALGSRIDHLEPPVEEDAP